MHKYVAIEYSRDFLSKEEFYNCGFDAYGEQFHNMNATLHNRQPVTDGNRQPVTDGNR